MKARTTSVLFAHSRLDAIPVLAGIAQLAFLLALYFRIDLRLMVVVIGKGSVDLRQ